MEKWGLVSSCIVNLLGTFQANCLALRVRFGLPSSVFAIKICGFGSGKDKDFVEMRCFWQHCGWCGWKGIDGYFILGWLIGVSWEWIVFVASSWSHASGASHGSSLSDFVCDNCMSIDLFCTLDWCQWTSHPLLLYLVLCTINKIFL